MQEAVAQQPAPFPGLSKIGAVERKCLLNPARIGDHHGHKYDHVRQDEPSRHRLGHAHPVARRALLVIVAVVDTHASPGPCAATAPSPNPPAPLGSMVRQPTTS